MLLFILFSTTLFSKERYFKFIISESDNLETITRLISIDKVKSDTVFAYANDQQFDAFLQLGYSLNILEAPSKRIEVQMARTQTSMASWDYYPTYEVYDSIMNQFATDYPSICQLVSIGQSTNGRELYFIKISDNVSIEEDEPEVMYSSSMHGDEISGYVTMLRLIDSLLVSYGSDSRITNMIDNMEIWINPSANPDGTYAAGNNTVFGATRGNANGYDLNRNFPDPDEGDHPDGHPWQAETIAMMNFFSQHSFIISANFHGGAEVINYPWDTWFRRHADDPWFIDICRMYADTAQANSPFSYFNDLDNGITNGWDWYPIFGGRQDYMIYWEGCRETTIELSQVKLVSEASLPVYWDYNKKALLDYLENSLYGFRGIVTDSLTGLPLAAQVDLVTHDMDNSFVFTDPDVGDYHRMIVGGSYHLQFSSPGYVNKTFYGELIADSEIRILNAQLVPILANDADNDFVDDAIDNCLGLYNPDQDDPDADLVGTLCDNCPDSYNPTQEDDDGDGIGDACENSCCSGIAGNINNDLGDTIDIADLTYLVDYMFKGGLEPDCLGEADLNGDNNIDISDLTFLVNYSFKGGPAPSSCL